MTGGDHMTIDIEVFCGTCIDADIFQAMKLTDDVERSEGEYQCPQCHVKVVVSLRVGN